MFHTQCLPPALPPLLKPTAHASERFSKHLSSPRSLRLLLSSVCGKEWGSFHLGSQIFFRGFFHCLYTPAFAIFFSAVPYCAAFVSICVPNSVFRCMYMVRMPPPHRLPALRDQRIFPSLRPSSFFSVQDLELRRGAELPSVCGFRLLLRGVQSPRCHFRHISSSRKQLSQDGSAEDNTSPQILSFRRRSVLEKREASEIAKHMGRRCRFLGVFLCRQLSPHMYA